MPAIPEGFEIEPSIPEGFEIEQEQPSNLRSFGSELMRQGGLGVRAVAEGGMDLVSPFADALSYGINAALPGDPFPARHSEAFSALLSRAGLPEPQSGAEKFSNVASRMITGAAAGGLIDKAVMGGLGLARAPAQAQAAPSTEQLKNWSRSAYSQAEKSGVVISPESFADNVGKIVGTAAKEGIDPTLHPSATAALKRLTAVVDSGRPVALQELETLRKVARGAAGSLSKDERRIARILVDSLDDYAMGLSASDVVAGNSAGVGQTLRTARDLWSRASKSDVVDDLVERARNSASQFSGSGYENALRTQFRALVKNPKRLRLFTPTEQQALKKVANGGAAENVLRYFGKLAPTGIVSTALSGGIGAVAAGPLGAVGVPLAGAISRQGATQLTARNARVAAELMRRGGPAAARSLTPEVAPAAIGATPSFVDWLMSERQ